MRYAHFLGETSQERKYRFLSGIGILFLVSSFYYFASYQMDAMVREQWELSQPSSVQGDRGLTVDKTRDFAESNPFADDRLDLAIKRRRAYLIAFALVSASLTMIYSWVLIRQGVDAKTIA